MAMEDNESCGSRAVESSPSTKQNRQERQRREVFNEVLSRLQDLNHEEARLTGFEDQLWLHFNRLPPRTENWESHLTLKRYALDVNVERAEDVLTHKRLLSLAEDPANRPAFDIRLVQVPSTSGNASDSINLNSPVEEDNHSFRKEGIHPPPTFGSSANLEALAHRANDSHDDDDGDRSISQIQRPMHEITFSTVDKPKLLSQLTSLLSEIGLNIQEAHAFSTHDGFSLDVFVVDGWPHEA